MIVPDTTRDERFSGNPLVTREPHLRFYAGAVLETETGLPLGTLCVLDYKPRELTSDQTFTLEMLSRQVMTQLELRRAIIERDEALEASRKTEERQILLVRELHHRVRNTLAMVQALLGSSARSSKDIDEFYETFSARIASLAKTQTLLTDDYWQTAPLRELLLHELEPFLNGRKDRVVLDGPRAELSADLAIPVGMAIHELTTNSAKYGALSTLSGHLTISWRFRNTDGRRRLYLEWIERGGPAVKEPERRGFGSTMLQRVLPAQTDADVQIEFRREGLRFEMEAPLIERRLVPQY
jgi:two-component sensor histidine kinase